MWEVIGVVAMALSLVGNWGVIGKHSWGMGCWIVSNVIWIAYDARLSAWSQTALFVVYLALAVKGFVDWRRDEIRKRSSIG